VPAESESQRKAAGAALGAKRGNSAGRLRGASKDMYENMTEDELEDFASKSKSSSDSLIKAIDSYFKENSQSSIVGYTSKNFDICPNAVNVFRKLGDSVNPKTRASILSAVRATDDFLGIEKKVVSSKSASLDDIEEMVDLMQSAHFHAGHIGALIGEDLSKDFAFSTGHLITVMEHYGSEQ
jgi:hypothetical protein